MSGSGDIWTYYQNQSSDIREARDQRDCERQETQKHYKSYYRDDNFAESDEYGSDG